MDFALPTPPWHFWKSNYPGNIWGDKIVRVRDAAGCPIEFSIIITQIARRFRFDFVIFDLRLSGQ